jgi:hypothetical protein
MCERSPAASVHRRHCCARAVSIVAHLIKGRSSRWPSRRSRITMQPVGEVSGSIRISTGHQTRCSACQVAPCPYAAEL